MEGRMSSIYIVPWDKQQELFQKLKTVSEKVLIFWGGVSSKCKANAKEVLHMKRMLIIVHEERDDACACHDAPQFMMHGHGEMMACGKVHLHKEPPAFPDWLKDFFEKLDQEDPPEDLMEWI